MEIKEMEYPGRGIVIGMTSEKKIFCTYFITARSSSSQSRKLVREGNVIVTKSTKEIVNEDLLIYNAIIWDSTRVIVGNGKHTDSIVSGDNGYLMGNTYSWDYEPDSPHYTARISGRVLDYNDSEKAMVNFCLIKKRHNGNLRQEFTPKLKPNEAHIITTYSGENKDPLPSFKEKLLISEIKSITSKNICDEIGNMLNPNFKVSIATFINENDISIINFRD